MLRAGEHEVEPSPISFRVPVRRQEGAHRVGRFVDGSFGLELELREGEREWGVGPPLECGAFSLQQFAELQASVARSACSNSRPSNHKWVMGDKVVVGEVVADTQALGERAVDSFVRLLCHSSRSVNTVWPRWLRLNTRLTTFTF